MQRTAVTPPQTIQSLGTVPQLHTEGFPFQPYTQSADKLVKAVQKESDRITQEELDIHLGNQAQLDHGIHSLRTTGVLKAAVPQELGGLGISDPRDIAAILYHLGGSSTSFIAAHHLGVFQVLGPMISTLPEPQKQYFELAAKDAVSPFGALITAPTLEARGNGNLNPGTAVTYEKKQPILSGEKLMASGAFARDTIRTFALTTASLAADNEGDRIRAAVLVPLDAMNGIDYRGVKTSGLKAAGNGILSFQSTQIHEGAILRGDAVNKWDRGNLMMSSLIVQYFFVTHYAGLTRARDTLATHIGTLPENQRSHTLDVDRKLIGIKSRIETINEKSAKLLAAQQSGEITEDMPWYEHFAEVLELKLQLQVEIPELADEIKALFGPQIVIEEGLPERVQRTRDLLVMTKEDVAVLQWMFLPEKKAWDFIIEHSRKERVS